MLSKKALFYYNNGFNCSQCLIKAYSDIYNIKIDPQIFNAAEVINKGFGIGNMCSAIVTAIIILSIHFDADTAKTKRLILLDRFHTQFNDFNCARIKKDGCELIIEEVCLILEDLL